MRRICLLLFVAVAAGAITPEQFASVVDFDSSISSLADLVRTGAYNSIDTERVFILQGTVASVQVFDPSPQTFQALIELVSSEWEGLQSIRIDRVYVLVEGPDYSARFDAQSDGPTSPIVPNTDLMVVGSFIGTALSEADEELAVVYGIALR